MFIKAAFNVALALTVAIGMRVAAAQTPPGPSRADVKKETVAAEQAHQLTPAGEGPFVQVPRTFTKTRAERKSATLAARRDKTLLPSGDAAMAKDDRRIAAAPSIVNRADRKAEVRTEERNRQLTPSGEGPDAPSK